MNEEDLTANSFDDAGQSTPHTPANNEEQGTPDNDTTATDPGIPARLPSRNLPGDDIIAKTKLTLPPFDSFSQSSPRPSPSDKTEPIAPSNRQVSPQAPTSPASGQGQNVSSTAKGPGFWSAPTLPFNTSAAPVPPRPAGSTARPTIPLSSGNRSRQTPGAGRRSIARSPLLFILLAVVLLLGVLTYAAINANASQGGQASTNGGEHSANNNETHSAPPNNSATPGNGGFQVGAHPLVIIKEQGGSVNIHSGSAGIVIVNKVTHGSSVEPNSNAIMVQHDQVNQRQESDRLTITTRPGYGNIDYDVSVPGAARVQVEINAGSVTVDGVSGASINTFSGSLDIEDIQGPVNAYTENGDITARTIKGQTALESENGSIRVDNVNGQLKAVTQNGDVVVREAILKGQSVLRTSSGSVRVEGAIDPRGTYKLETDHGDINLTIPNDAAFQLNASTGSGSIDNEFGSNETGMAPRAPITISIGSGSITIHKES